MTVRIGQSSGSADNGDKFLISEGAVPRLISVSAFEPLHWGGCQILRLVDRPVEERGQRSVDDVSCPPFTAIEDFLDQLANIVAGDGGQGIFAQFRQDVRAKGVRDADPMVVGPSVRLFL